MAMDSEEPVVVITGCSNGGIGHSLTLALVENNCLVVATSRSLSSMRSLEDDSRVFLEELDVVSEESIREVIENVLNKYGRIDVLVNNAGMNLVGPLADSTVEQVFNTNVYGTLRLIQVVFPHMMSRRKGKIVNVGSVAALAPGPWASVYSTSKAVVYALSNSLRVELSTCGVKVINVAPSAITSNLGNSSLTRYEQMPEWKRQWLLC